MADKIVAKETYQAGDQDFSAQLTAIRGSQPDVIFVPGYYTDVGNIALQARKLGITVPLLGGDGWDSAKLGEIAGEAIDGSFYSNHYSHQDPRSARAGFHQEVQGAVRRHARWPGRARLRRGADPVRRDRPGRLARQAPISPPSWRRPRISTASPARSRSTKDRNAVKPAVMLEMKDGVPTYVTTIEP